MPKGKKGFQPGAENPAKKGKTNNAGGRPGGSKGMRELAEICRRNDDNLVVELVAIAVAWRKTKSMANASVAAIKELFNRGHGQAPQKIEGEGLDALAALAKALTMPDDEEPKE